MTIQFSEQELADMKRCLDNLTQVGSLLPPEEDEVKWNRLFLLFRKLLAYGVHQAGQMDPAVPYPTLQKISQKPDAMREVLRIHSSDFSQLLQDCVARHQALF